MINTTYGTAILNAFFHTGYTSKTTSSSVTKISDTQLNDTKNNAVVFPNEPFLALFTTPPNAEGENWTEPTTKSYNRVSLVTKGPKNVQLMKPAEAVDGNKNGDEPQYAGKKVAQVENQDIIVFPEIEDENEGYQEKVVAFGVFSADGKENNNGELLLWGDLTQETTIKVNEIPVFRIGQFVFKLA